MERRNRSYDTELLDAALAPGLAGEFGRKANGLEGAKHSSMMDTSSEQPAMAYESEHMPNSLTVKEQGVEKAAEDQLSSGQFGQKEGIDAAMDSSAQDGFFHPNIFPQGDFFSTGDDEFYSRLDSNPNLPDSDCP
ncbi:hypothetical protein FJT64_009573 [Amphibalanus amphitrite]|uniref:Uncharacterized protein n=1 Tax=Amphibalanus amphitrite TaxID=1232801 RepID=A0A6A4VQK9_AMPAM|nr:hypothetical protein FJT64_009573 [Amphibalanus amphitrite]